MREAQTEVLVAGAGPVGLLSALLLARAGVQVTIIDREQRTAARSYACALHSKVLELLHKLDLAEPLVQRGRKIERVALYDRERERAALDLSRGGGQFPFIVILAQSELESILEESLRKAGVHVQWNHRFKDLTEQSELVETTIEELGGTGTGYIVPHWETVVKNQASLRAQFVIGADGSNSTVRQKLRIENERTGEIAAFAAFEFEPDPPVGGELRVVLEETTNVLWPLPGNRCRWTFQLLRSELADFPEKERRASRLAEPQVDQRIRDYIENVARRRAPWFKSAVKEIAWCTEVAFERRVARQFGRNRCWLAGDAAHQTGPAGVQSMNAGLLEAAALTDAIRGALRQEPGAAGLPNFGQHELQNWRRLTGLSGGLKKRHDTDEWVGANASKILPCLPASGADLARLAEQLKLDWT